MSCVEQGTINATGLRRSDTRRFGLNLRYNLVSASGKSKSCPMWKVEQLSGHSTVKTGAQGEKRAAQPGVLYLPACLTFLA
jgi:hypothetical protein